MKQYLYYCFSRYILLYFFLSIPAIGFMYVPELYLPINDPLFMDLHIYAQKKKQSSKRLFSFSSFPCSIDFNSPMYFFYSFLKVIYLLLTGISSIL